MQEKLNLSRLNMLYGRIIEAPEAMKIKGIIYPDSDIPSITLDASSIKNNRFDINGTEISLFAEDEALFKGQFIAAVFSSDYENAELIARDVKIDGEKPNRANETDDLMSLSFGDIEAVRNGRSEKVEKTVKETDEEGNEIEKVVEDVEYVPYKSVSSVFLLKETESPVKLWYTVNAVYENGILYVSAPNQYPGFLKRIVSSLTKIEEEKIVFYQKDYYAPFDEYLFESAMLAAIASAVAIENRQAVEIRKQAYSRRGEIRSERLTYITDDEKLIGEEVTYTVEMGAYLPFKSEYFRHVSAAIVPNYPLSAFKADVRFIKSARYPYSFYLSLGFSEALASTEYHEARISDYLNLSPMAFKAYYYKDKRRFTDYIPALELAEIKKLTQKTMLKSSFERKWASHQLKNKDYALLGFSRGNGFASGYSISGFSTSFAKEHEYTSKITYNAKDQIIVTISEAANEKSMNLWRQIIKKEMGYEKDESVIFIKSSTSDSGPRILSRYVSNFSKQLLIGIRKIKELRSTENPPFSIVLSLENKFFPCEFDEGGFASMAISVRIDETDYQSMIEEIYADYSLGYMLDENLLLSAVKEEILSTLTEMGARFTPDVRISISFTRKDSESIASPMQVTRALAIAAFLNATSQALKEKNIALPLSDEDVLRLRRMN